MDQDLLKVIMGQMATNVAQVAKNAADNAEHALLIARSTMMNLTMLNMANTYRVDSESGSGAARLLPQVPMVQAAAASKPAGT